MTRFWRRNSLTLVFFALFLVALSSQLFVGLADHNRTLTAEGLVPAGIWDYLTSSQFAVDVAENWQSEFLQFALFITATVWLVQAGSPESDPPGEQGPGTDAEERVGPHAPPDAPPAARAGGWRAAVYGRSLGILMAAIFVASWAVQAVTGWTAHNADRLRSLQDPLDFGAYLMAPDFWNRTLQNWQSEFLAVTSMVIFSVYLRQRGSAQSKRVGDPHSVVG